MVIHFNFYKQNEADDSEIHLTLHASAP